MSRPARITVRRGSPDGRTFYGSRLSLARRCRGLSRAELEALTGIDRRRLYEYEEDRRTPPAEHVEAIALATRFPADFFYRGESPRINPRTVFFCGRGW